MKTIAVLPVKRLDSAYARLDGLLSADQRRQVAEATMLDTLAKLRRSRTIDETIVVTSDPGVARHADWLGHVVVEQGRTQDTRRRRPPAPAPRSSGPLTGSRCSRSTAPCSIPRSSTSTLA